jgi:uncharacterized membrane protein YczE
MSTGIRRRIMQVVALVVGIMLVVFAISDFVSATVGRSSWVSLFLGIVVTGLAGWGLIRPGPDTAKADAAAD